MTNSGIELPSHGAFVAVLLATVVGCGGHASSPPPDLSNASAPGSQVEAPSTASGPEQPLDGLQVGEHRENHYGVWKDWQPVYLDRRVSITPDARWGSLEEARNQLGELTESSAGRPSSVAILAIEGHFVAHYLTKQPGSQSDIRRWHIETEFRTGDPRWVDTVDGPDMNPRPEDATAPSATP